MFLRKDKNIIYKEKSYPIDFMVLTRYSLFFYEKQNEYKDIKNIEISDNGIEIHEDSIKNFILFCQFEHSKIHITNSNVFSLRQLAIDYNVPGLIKITNDHITTNNKDLVIQSLYHHYLHNHPDNDDEDYISAHFFDYINDTRLIKLPVAILYRILNNSNIQKIDDMDDQHRNQIFDFMFKCLDEHKKSASILFKNCDLNDANIDIINRLLNDYKDIFDFNMINTKETLKRIPVILNEINKIKLEHTQFLSNAQLQFNSFQTKINELMNLIHNQSEEINVLKDTIDAQKKEINDLKELNVLQASNLEHSINDKMNDLTQNITNNKQSFEQELNKLKEKIQNTQNIVDQHENAQKLFVTKKQLRNAFQAGRKGTREIQLWVNERSWNNNTGTWSTGAAVMGDNINNWINDRRNLCWNAFEPWDAAIVAVPE